MKFYPLLDVNRPETLTEENLKGMRTLNLMPVQAYVSLAQFAAAGGQGLPAEGTTPKFWRDNSALAWGDGAPRQYVYISQEPWLINYSDADAMSIFSQTAVNFYREYSEHFKLIPKPMRVTETWEESVRINFAATGQPEPFPVAAASPAGLATTTFPANVALRFNPQNGQAEAFLIEEYVRTYPMNWQPKAPPVSNIGTTKMTDFELVTAAQLIVSSQSPLNEKARAIRSLAGR